MDKPKGFLDIVYSGLVLIVAGLVLIAFALMLPAIIKASYWVLFVWKW